MTSVCDGVAPRGGYADAPGVDALGFDPVLGRMLVAAARKELDAGPVQLTLDYPALPEVRQVVPRLVEAWKRVGVTVTPRELPPSLLESRLRSGELVRVGVPRGDLRGADCRTGDCDLPGI